MCGIFGMIVGKGSAFTPNSVESTVNRLFGFSESRGKEASGLAVLSRDTIQVYKRPIPASSLIRSKGYNNLFSKTFTNGSSAQNTIIHHPVTIIGHSRLVTTGTQDYHQNNQPVIAGGMVGIHNGIITNDEKLWQQFPTLDRQCQIDTEVLLSLIRLFYNEKKSLIEAIQTAFTHIQGYASVAVLLNDFNQLVLATNNGSLYLCSNKAGSIHIFASEQYILTMLMKKRYLQKSLGEYNISHIKAGYGCLVNINDLSIRPYSLDNNRGGGVAVESNSSPRKIVDIPPPEEQKSVIAARNIGGTEVPFILPKTFVDQFPENEAAVVSLKRCSKCVLPETMPFIEFDDKGVCNYCRNYKKMVVKGKADLEESVARYRSNSGESDCIVSLSGGRDSSYALHYIKNVLKMNPVAYTYDWGMVTDLARRNQSRICGKLGIEHILMSADINWKRSNIRKNVLAWLKKPDLGTVPLFMAGDKIFLWYVSKVKQQIGVDLIFLNVNRLERTDFKTGFCGVKPPFANKQHYKISFLDGIILSSYYAKKYISNPAYLNSSLLDTIYAYISYYLISHDFVSLFDYIKWDENEINSVLIKEYGWEVATDTKSTWRIGDGTAAFYNYIYYTVAGLTENDTFRSNQIREGTITREQALKFLQEDSKPRYESIDWYCNTIGVDFNETIKTINAIPKRYSFILNS